MRVLSAEPLPIVPRDLEPDLYKYEKDLQSYLQRLTRLLTGENIRSSMQEELGLPGEFKDAMLALEPLFWLRMQEGTLSGNLVDQMGNHSDDFSYTGTFSVDHISIPGPISKEQGKGVFWNDATSDYIQTTGNQTINMQAHSVSLWVRPSGPFTLDRAIIGFDDNDVWADVTEPIRMGLTSTGVLRYEVKQDVGPAYVTLNSITTLSSGVWTNVVGTYEESGTIDLYINGTKEASAASDIVDSTTWARMYVGRSLFSTFTNRWRGSMAELAYFTKKLSQAQVQSLYQTAGSHQ